jgi:sulfatase maturation enzyme AslB (radical SAM superfamily)
MNWFEKLSAATHCHQREEIAADPTCLEEVLTILIKEDVEETVIQAGVNNPSCPKYLKEIGLNRLLEIEERKKQENNSSICPIPWTHIGIQQNGDFRICCQAIYAPFGKLKDNDVTLNIKNTDINSARNHKDFKSLRLQMLKNQKPELCKLCYKEEDVGLNSKRKFMLKKYDVSFYDALTAEDGSISSDQFPLRYIDIRFGNLCNLKCRYCGPGDSSLWYEDFVEHHKTDVINYYGQQDYKLEQVNNKWTIKSLDFEWYEDEKFWREIKNLLPYIDRYYFTGGEPTINKTHYNLLQLIIDEGYSSKVVLEYNSNMVAIPEKLYEQWDQFQEVAIGCSIDGYQEYAYYMRYPSKWPDLEENLDILGYRSNKRINGSISTTINVFNILNFLDLTKWLLSKNYTRIKKSPSYHVLEGPSSMSVQVLPQETKEYIRQQYELFYTEIDNLYGKGWGDEFRKNYSGIINYMMAKDNSQLLPILAKETKSLDAIRNQNIANVIPWLAKILEEVG